MTTLNDSGWLNDQAGAVRMLDSGPTRFPAAQPKHGSYIP